MRQFDRLRRASAPRMLAGGAVAAFGIYGLLNVMQPAAVADGGLLCYVIPGFGAWLR